MKILKKKEVVRMTSLSHVTIWRLERKGQFPRRICLSEGRVGWIEQEVLNWIASRSRFPRGNQ